MGPSATCADEEEGDIALCSILTVSPGEIIPVSPPSWPKCVTPSSAELNVVPVVGSAWIGGEAVSSARISSSLASGSETDVTAAIISAARLFAHSLRV